MDIGVGSGYYLKKHLPLDTRRIALVDLNDNSLESASKAIRYRKLPVEIFKRNILEPLKLEGEKFDSVSINYLLHCLPGSLENKKIVFSNIKDILNDDGVIFGSTILGKGIKKNFVAGKLMDFYINKGIFSNYNDDLATLVITLNEFFYDIEVSVIGCVAIFSGNKSYGS